MEISCKKCGKTYGGFVSQTFEVIKKDKEGNLQLEIGTDVHGTICSVPMKYCPNCGQKLFKKDLVKA